MTNIEAIELERQIIKGIEKLFENDYSLEAIVRASTGFLSAKNTINEMRDIREGIARIVGEKS